MIRIVRAEIYKYTKSNIMKIMTLVALIYALVQCLSLISVLYVNIGAIEANQIISIKGYQAFDNADMASIFTFFVPFMIVFSFTSEFSKKTFGNLLGCDVTKTELFISKYIAFCIVIVSFSFLLALLSTCIATCANGWGDLFHVSQIADIVLLALRVSLVQIAGASLLIVLSLYLHNDAAIVILYFVFSLLESIITALISKINISSDILRFLIDSMPSNCIDGFQVLNIEYSVLIHGLYYTLSSILLCVLVGSWAINKMDINY